MDNQYSIISICNWKHFQGEGTNSMDKQKSWYTGMDKLNQEKELTKDKDNKEVKESNFGNYKINWNTIPTTNKNNHKYSKTEYPKEFEEIYKIYPKKSGKFAAFTSWKKLNPNPSLQITIKNAVFLYSRTDKWKNGYAPGFQRFLNQRWWEDEIPNLKSGDGKNERKTEWVDF